MKKSYLNIALAIAKRQYARKIASTSIVMGDDDGDGGEGGDDGDGGEDGDGGDGDDLSFDLDDDDKAELQARYDNETGELVGDAKEDKQKEIEKLFREEILAEAKKDKERFDELKKQDEHKDKSDDEINALIAEEKEQAATAFDPKFGNTDPFADPNAKKPEDGDGGGAEDPAKTEEYQQNMRYITQVNQMFEEHPALKMFVDAVAEGKDVDFIKLVTQNYMDVDSAQPASIMKKYFEGLKANSNGLMNDDSVIKGLEKWNGLEDDDPAKIAQLLQAKEYVKKAQPDLLSGLKVSPDALKNKTSAPTVRNKVSGDIKELTSGMIGKVFIGNMKLTQEAVESIERRVKTGEFTLMKPDGTMDAARIAKLAWLEENLPVLLEKTYQEGVDKQRVATKIKKSRTSIKTGSGKPLASQRTGSRRNQSSKKAASLGPSGS